MFSKVREIHGNLETSKTLGKIFARHKLIDCKGQLCHLKSFHVLQIFQQINQLSKQKTGQKVAFAVTLL